MNPLNLLPDINALMGITYLHLGGVYDNTSLTDSGVIDQGQYGDTHYYLISTDILPLLMPLEKPRHPWLCIGRYSRPGTSRHHRIGL